MDTVTEMWTFAAFVGIATLLYWTLKTRRLPYPPGPKGLPVLGMVFRFPRERPWIRFQEWSKEYDSDVVSIEVCGKRIVVLNSYTATQDLMVKRSMIYSDRPNLPMVNDLQGWKWNFAFMSYGPEWKEHRKLFKQEVQDSALEFARPHALSAAHRLLGSILTKPEDYVAHIKHLTGYFTLSTAYGIDIKPSGDPYVHIGEMANEGLVRAVSFPPYLVDVIPALKYVPDWFPGARFKRDAKVWANFAITLREKAFQAARQCYAQGTIKPSVASRGLEQVQNDTDRERRLKGMLGTFYSAGVDTAVSALSTFILAMVLHPEIQQKARKAIVDAVGHDRLPDFDDVESIPYLHAVVREGLRWQPVAHTGIPHATAADDVYNGYFIPKGSTIIGNSWAMLQDKSIFGKDTHRFQPERFLTEDGSMLNPAVPFPEMAFGFGRRACPGQSLAYHLLLITSAALLHCFEMNKTKDKDGREIQPTVECTTGLVSYPRPFACEFKVHSTKLRGLILESSKSVEN